MASELPAHAHERLLQMRKSHFFTSDLSVPEFLLVKEAGFEPLGLVLGNSIYHIGPQLVRWGANTEMQKLTQALYHSRELAMARMEAEADELGADGIVGVRLTVSLHAWGSSVAEFLAIGTAVHSRDGGSWRTNSGKPFTSDLSGQDFWTLLRAGYRPLGLVLGNCVYHVGRQGVVRSLLNAPRTMELPLHTQALYDARELAMERMQAEAETLGAEGVVGVTVEESHHSWRSHILEFLAIGTAVTAISEDHHIPPPQLVLSVND